MSEKIGITTTVSPEIIYAAGKIPVDLNNIFISSENRLAAIAAAELAGYPRTVCGWIKGIYGMVAHYRAVDTLIAVTEGDCSQTHALMETLDSQGINVIPFSFPFDRDESMLKRQMEKLAHTLGADWDEVLRQRERLNAARKPVWEIDRMTWEDGLVTGEENHYYQISCSDFEGEPEKFAARSWEFIKEARSRQPFKSALRIGFIGVPPIMDDLHSFVEAFGVRVVFNEVQRQFSLPYPESDFLESYLRYTYPYHVKRRVEDIRREIERRQLDGIIHYTQGFCFRQIEDIIFRRELGVPILSLEGDAPGPVDARTAMRIETFLSMLK